MIGSTTIAPQKRNCSEASGAAAPATVTEYGIMYGQNITIRLSQEAKKNSTVRANGAPSRLPRTPDRISRSDSSAIAGNTKPEGRTLRPLRENTLKSKKKAKA